MDYMQFNASINVSRETFDRLALYHDQLVKWQRSVNLISVNTIPHIWHRHILDSAQLANHITDFDGLLVDFGSGAGLPGVILAIMGLPNVVLVESDTKKVVFLQEIRRILDVDYKVIHDRIEALDDCEISYITARGCAPLIQLCQWGYRLMSPQTKCLFPKGRNYVKEVEDAMRDWHFHYQAHTSITDRLAVIIELSQLQKR